MGRHLPSLRAGLRFVTTVLPAVSALAFVACSNQAAEPGAAAPTASAAPAAPAFQPAKLGASVFILHEIKDPDGFEKFFEQGVQRDASGVKGHLVSKLPDGRAIVHLFADDMNGVQMAVNSEVLKGIMFREGAPDHSFIWVTNDISVSLSTAPPPGQTFSLYYKLEVPDFETFRREFDARDPLYAAHAVIGRGLHQSPSQRIVVVHFVGTERERLEALQKDPEFVKLMALAAPEGAGKPLLAVDQVRSRPGEGAPAAQ